MTTPGRRLAFILIRRTLISEKRLLWSARKRKQQEEDAQSSGRGAI